MKAIRVIPGRRPEIIQVDNTLKALQEQVGGRIETISIDKNLVGIVNEEMILLSLPYNGRIGGQHIFGTLLVVGLNGEEFCDVPENFSFEMMRPMAYPGNV